MNKFEIQQHVYKINMLISEGTEIFSKLEGESLWDMDVGSSNVDLEYAKSSFDRWRLRVKDYLQENISERESKEFDSISRFWSGDPQMPVKSFIDDCVRYTAFLTSLKDELVNHPDMVLSKRNEQVMNDKANESYGNQETATSYLDESKYQNERGYIVTIANQVNGCYLNGFYDAQAVMLRRLTETLLIDIYIAEGREEEIKDGNGNFQTFERLIEMAKSKNGLNIGRETKRVLPKIKLIGDNAAHLRTFNANKSQLDEIRIEFTIALQDLLNNIVRSKGS